MKSHQAILEIARARDNKYVFIFEDDAVLRYSFGYLKQVVEEMTDWEIILFSVSHTDEYELHDNFVVTKSGVELLKLHPPFGGTYAMAVSSKAYDKLIDCMESCLNVNVNVDIDVYSVVCKNIYLTLPFMSYVLSDQSDIRKYDTTGDLEQIKLCESRLLVKTSYMSNECLPS